MEKSLIEKYFSEGLSEDEYRQLLEWIEKDESNRRYFASVKNAWAVSGLGSVQDPSAEKEYGRFITHTVFFKSATVTLPGSLFSRIGIRMDLMKRAILVAASVIVLAATGLGLYIILGGKHEPRYYLVSTNSAEKSEVHLPDGTSIWLNAETKIKIPENIFRKKIDIFLEGEAFFDIPHIRGRKITVHTSDLKINVVGTAFNVKNYPGEKNVETTLIRGKIVIEKTSENITEGTVTIKPNERYVYDKEKRQGMVPIGENLVESGAKTAQNTVLVPLERKDKKIPAVNTETELEKYIAWKDGRFVFRSERFEDLSRRMERWFGVKILLTNPGMRDVKFNGSFEKETIEQALHALSTSYSFRYTINHDTICIIPK